MARIDIKSPSELELMRKAGILLRQVFTELEKHIQPGISTGELDAIARKLIVDAGAKPAFLGYRGFPGTLCTSVNEQVVHGIPGKQVLKDGDIISVDCGLKLNGFFSDTASTYAVGTVTPEAQRLMDVTRESLNKAIAEIRPGARLGTIGHAVQSYVEAHGYSVVRDLGGHGIGRSMHEEPHVPNYGRPETGLRLAVGMVIAVEPMVNEGVYDTRTLRDKWTVVTADGKLSAHFEHTLAVVEDGCLVLTA